MQRIYSRDSVESYILAFSFYLIARLWVSWRGVLGRALRRRTRMWAVLLREWALVEGSFGLGPFHWGPIQHPLLLQRWPCAVASLGGR